VGEALRFGGYRKSQLDEVKRTRGERVEDGTAQRDKPLFQVSSPLLTLWSLDPLLQLMCLLVSPSPLQILQENKEKKDAEFNERFKHSMSAIHMP